jgi:hypothetical protein
MKSYRNLKREKGKTTSKRVAMKKSKKELKKLKESARNKLVVLGSSNIRKNKFRPTFVMLDGYLDLFVTIEALINVCILAAQGDSYSPPHVKHPGEDIRKTLELVTQLLPFDEGEFLDGVNRLLNKEKS